MNVISKYLPYIVIVLLTIITTLSFYLHSRVEKISELEQTVSRYEEVIENNNHAINLLKKDVAYTEDLLSRLQQQREETEQEYTELEGEWQRLREQDRRHANANNQDSSTTVNLSEHFRVLQQAACSANRDCL